jgi:hypothetical protein
MTRFSRARLLGFVATASLGLASCTPPVFAREAETFAGRGFLCNSEQEVAEVVTANEAAVRANLARADARFGKGACTFATVLFSAEAASKSVSTSEGIAHIEKVKLIGYLVGHELRRKGEPTDQYFGYVDEGKPGA